MPSARWTFADPVRSAPSKVTVDVLFSGAFASLLTAAGSWWAQCKADLKLRSGSAGHWMRISKVCAAVLRPQQKLFNGVHVVMLCGDDVGGGTRAGHEVGVEEKVSGAFLVSPFTPQITPSNTSISSRKTSTANYYQQCKVTEMLELSSACQRHDYMHTRRQGRQARFGVFTLR